MGPRAKLKTYCRVSEITVGYTVDGKDSALYFGEFKPESNSDTNLNYDEQFHLDRRDNGKVPTIQVEWVYYYHDGDTKNFPDKGYGGSISGAK